jgi:hypothetical protein
VKGDNVLKRLAFVLAILAPALWFSVPLAPAADITITATSVAKGSGATVTTYYAGETITAGQVLYLHTDGLVYKSDSNGTSAQKAANGIALNGGATGQPVAVQTAGSITIGATVATGTIYVVSGTAGGIAPHGDLASGMETIIIGVATSTTVIALNFYDSGASVP